MNSASEDSRRGLFFGPAGNGNRTQYVTLIIAVSLGFLFTIALYTWRGGGNASSRWDYAIFVSLIPAIGAFLLLRLTKISLTWLGVAALYLILFFLMVAIAIVQLRTQFKWRSVADRWGTTASSEALISIHTSRGAACKIGNLS
jgi:hypothetical protein